MNTKLMPIGEANEPPALYPLQFEPIYQHRFWGGRRLTSLFSASLPGDDPIGEAWLLSDRDDHPSLIANGPLKGKTLASLFHEAPEALLGKMAGHFQRFPLLLKFLDVKKKLSVQVHPSDDQTEYIPAGESGKTEAWVVLETGPDSRIYAGLKSAMTADEMRCAIKEQTVSDHLASFQPKLSDSVLVSAGTVHSLADIVVFEVQENSDVTFRRTMWTRRRASSALCRSIRHSPALILHGLRLGRRRPWWRRRPQSGGSGSFSVNISRCRESLEKQRSLSALTGRRVCWCASLATAR